MIDPETSWFEIKKIPGTNQTDVVANAVEQTWLYRYPSPTKVILDRDTEFMAEFKEIGCQKDTNHQTKPTR